MPSETKEFLCKKCGACFASTKPVCVVCKSTETKEIKEHGVAKEESESEVKIEE